MPLCWHASLLHTRGVCITTYTASCKKTINHHAQVRTSLVCAPANLKTTKFSSHALHQKHPYPKSYNHLLLGPRQLSHKLLILRLRDITINPTVDQTACIMLPPMRAAKVTIPNALRFALTACTAVPNPPHALAHIDWSRGKLPPTLRHNVATSTDLSEYPLRILSTAFKMKNKRHENAYQAYTPSKQHENSSWRGKPPGYHSTNNIHGIAGRRWRIAAGRQASCCFVLSSHRRKSSITYLSTATSNPPYIR